MNRARLSLFERLVAADIPDHAGGCWEWQGSCCNKGYGQIKTDGVSRRVHIVAWELVKGRKVRAGYTLDHDCRNKACWRPSHMVEMTRAKNTAKGNRDNPRSTVAASAARRKRRGIEVVVHNAGLLREAFNEAAKKFEDAGPLFKL